MQDYTELKKKILQISWTKFVVVAMKVLPRDSCSWYGPFSGEWIRLQLQILFWDKCNPVLPVLHNQKTKGSGLSIFSIEEWEVQKLRLFISLYLKYNF